MAGESFGRARETQARKLPTRLGRKEVTVGCANMGSGRDARSTAQDVLAGHEFAVVLANQAVN